jgi:lysophospholipase L1-like esterase
LVDSAKPRSALDHLTGTYHFSHQVDEVLTGQFPDILLLWIGHNDVDWKWRTDSRTRSSFLELSNLFGQRYEAQLRRLLDGALASDNPAVIVVFGLTNFESFFKARRAAENMKSEDSSLFPHLDSAYRYFVSMRPEYRDGMIELAAIKAD